MSREIFEVSVDQERKYIRIYNEVFIYGELASQELAKQLANDIGSAWNEPEGRILMEEEEYEVYFDIRGAYLEENVLDIIQ